MLQRDVSSRSEDAVYRHFSQMDFDSEMERQEQFISEFCVAFEYFKNLVIIILYIFLLLFSDLFILPIFRTAHQNPAFRDGLHPQTSDTTPLTGG